MQLKLLFLITGIGLMSFQSKSTIANERPLIGAQIWIEPGQTPAQIDRWFKLLAEYQMPVTRIFLSWNYLEPEPGRWDFSLYDLAFQAAEKYGVKIVATLTAHYGPPHRGFWYQSQGSGIVSTAAELEPAANYIQAVVEHYKNSSALDTWMLMNEPGQSPAPDPLAVERFRNWLKLKYKTIENLNQAWMTQWDRFETIAYSERWSGGGFTNPIPFVDWYTFWREHLSWHLNWVAQEIRKSDSKHPIHVNPHALVGNLANISADLPAWRPFLNSLGASIHPAWHFGLLKRDQFGLGVSYICDLIHGSSEPNPFWVTELQGGNNLYSSMRPLCPTEEDIAQWVWTSVGAGAERIIFWLLNARRQGNEACEWSLLDFQDRPSERLKTAAGIAQLIHSQRDLFESVRPIDSPITILLSLGTMTLQRRYHSGDFPGRGEQAHVQSALAFYQCLQELGLPVRIKFFDDFEWKKSTSEPQMLILPHVTVLTAEQVTRLESFIQRGHSTLITGLTGYFDAVARCWPLEEFLLTNLCGARLKEIRLIEKNCSIDLTQPPLTLPAHLWIGEIENQQAEIISTHNDWTTGISHQFGKGKVYWFPSLIGLGAWLGDNAPLAAWLKELVQPLSLNLPLQFSQHQPHCLMRILKSESDFISVLTNGGNGEERCYLLNQAHLKVDKIFWGKPENILQNGLAVKLGPKETVVVYWKK